MEILVGILIAACLGLGGALVLSRRRARGPSAAALAGSALEGLRRVGELVVLRAYWSIPAVGEDHIFGDVGKKFLGWLWSQNKTIMIFRFEIRFKYDLRDPASVRIAPGDPGVLEVALGKPSHEISLADVRFWHTEKGQLLDWLLPRAVNIFQSDMDDGTRQKILEAAQESARQEAQKHAQQLAPEARLSAESILTALARSAGFSGVQVVEPGAPDHAVAGGKTGA
ncbi:MAG TPA: DUF4230 domain-containing protein [Planctomycetota bacterium]|jgi:hypothetical protein|nr:DUF4230 domain-containing protein [Planctomycetota bacterium]